MSPPWILIGVIGLIVALIIWGIKVENERRHRPATVIDRSHSPAYYGKPYRSESWELIVRDDAGNVYAISVDADEWAATERGTRINDKNVEK